MRRLNLIVALVCLCMLNCYNVHSQNPNWVMPGGHFQPGSPNYLPLPQNPAWPNGYLPGTQAFDQNFKYTGARANYTQASYTGSNGELMCFVVDGHLYDKNGWLVNYVSTGGGAMLEYLEGKELPGIAAIRG